jgi:RND family efflux transporter MFP subunit
MTRLTFVLLATAAAACSRPHAETTVSPSAPAVAVAKVTRGDISRVLSISAEFRPFQEIDVHAKVAGYLKSISVDVGDRVQSGQLLGVLEVPEMQDQVQQDQASVSHAEQEINRSQADLERAESAHDVAHLAAGRLQSVLKARPNLVAQQDIDEAMGRDRVAEAQVSTAKAALAAARQQLEISKANLAKTRTLFEYSRITAPFAGVITHRYADTGAMIQMGTSSQTQAMPIVRLSESNVLRLTIPVPESAVPRIHVGAAVQVKVAALGRTFTGTVSRFADKIDEQTRTMHTEVDVKNPNLELVPGMYATAALTLDERKGVLTVPVSAVDRVGDKVTTDRVDADGTLHIRPIKLGLETADRLEVLEGLTEDDLVVVANRTQLREGVTVSPKLAQSAAATAEK